MLRVAGIHVRIGGYPVLRSVHLRVEPGQTVGLVGHNGAGKTTTLRAIMGLVPVAAGEIQFDGVRMNHRPPYDRARLGIGYMPEDRRLIGSLTVEENLLLPSWALGVHDAAARLAQVYQLVPELAQWSHRTARELSGGQQKIVALARAFMGGGKLLLLDEPFEGVAPALAQRLAQVIRDFQAHGLAVVVAESDTRRVRWLTDTAYVIERGQIITFGRLDP